MSTYGSNSTFFGFDVAASALNEPATSVRVSLSVALSSSYTQIGFNIILVCDGFNSIVNFVAFNMSVHNTFSSVNALIPLNNNYATFFEGIYIVSANPSNCKLIILTASLDYPTQTAKLLYYVNSTSGVLYNPIKYVRAFILIFDTALRTNTLRYKHLSWSWQTTTLKTTTTINGNSNKTTYNKS